jgi:2-C-methyl-D-erythritol 4-phosphate cytidylyltransferase
MNGDVTVLILAAGMGARMKTSRPKQFLVLGDDQVLDHAISAVEEWSSNIIVTLPDIAHAQALNPHPNVQYVQGGETRTESVKLGLEHVKSKYVLVHDAARPFVTRDLLDEVVDKLASYPCVYPVMPVVNSLVVDEGGFLADTPSRERFREVQTPQGFHTTVLQAALDSHADEHPHLPELVRRLGYPVKHVEGDPWLFKITYPPSFQMAQYYVDNILPARKRNNS